MALAFWAGLAQVAKLWGSDLPTVLALPLYSGVVEFLMGGLIAHRLGVKAGDGLAGLATAAGGLGLVAVVTGLVPLSLGREWVAGLPAALLVYGLARGNWRVPDWTLVWGEASYILYLSHLLVFSISGTVLRMAGLNVYSHPLGLFGLLGLALAVAWAATLLLERPYRRWSRPRRATRHVVGGVV